MIFYQNSNPKKSPPAEAGGFQVADRQGGSSMATKTNFILKVSDAKLADIQKALKDANIAVVSILEIHKEEA
jgi:hypothetical protein